MGWRTHGRNPCSGQLNVMVRPRPLEGQGEVAMRGEGERAVGGVTVGVAGLGVVLDHMLGRVGGVGGQLGHVGRGRTQTVRGPRVGVR